MGRRGHRPWEAIPGPELFPQGPSGGGVGKGHRMTSGYTEEHSCLGESHVRGQPSMSSESPSAMGSTEGFSPMRDQSSVCVNHAF